jgi:hypothetical protein
MVALIRRRGHLFLGATVGGQLEQSQGGAFVEGGNRPNASWAPAFNSRTGSRNFFRRVPLRVGCGSERRQRGYGQIATDLNT